ncbi:MAG: alpha/beta hydrolase [Pseudomonadota bacterium]
MTDGYVTLHKPAKTEDQPMLVLLHGTGGDEVSFAELGRMIAPEAGLLSVRGDVDEMGHARFFRRRAEGVYDMDDLAYRTGKLAGFLTKTTHQLGIETDRLVGIGYSNGANILANLLMTRPDLLRRAVLMHPLIPFEPAPQPDLANADVLITAGRNDPISPLALTQRLADWFRAQGAKVNLALHDGGHQLLPQEIDAARTLVDRMHETRAIA